MNKVVGAALCLLAFTAKAQQAGQLAPFEVGTAGIKVKFGFYAKNHLRQLSILPEAYATQQKVEPIAATGHEVSLHVTGANKGKHVGEPGTKLIYIGRHERETPDGKELVVVEKDSIRNLLVESFYEFNKVSPVIRRYTRVTNKGTEDVGIETLSSAMLYNFSNITPGTINDNLKISYAYDGSLEEGQWKTSSPADLGLDDNGHQYFHNAIEFNSQGTRSTAKYIPMGMIENTKAGLTWFWQIEHNGSWFWKMSSGGSKAEFAYMGGPDDAHSQAWKNLKPGESYQTVPVALGCVKGGLNEAVAALTAYRRAVVIKKHDDDVKCPVIFNDYMNCIWADPTTEKETPMIDAVAKLGIKYYVIDAGWHAQLKENWTAALGLWEPSTDRFKGGLATLINYIRSKGMEPGLWLEFEVVGINSPLKSKPDNWFLQRHGKRVIDNSRYLLDFRNPEVRAYITSVFDRLIKDFGVKYFKIDYNSGEAIGTDYNAESPGQGLLEHNRALLQWYTELYKKYPDLIIEACGSGGARFDYATLAQAQLESFSDQSNYKKAPAIIVGEMAAILPEQLGIWSYPKSDGDAKSASFNMVNAMFGRMYMSGQLPDISKESWQQVIDGLAIYRKTFAPILHNSAPFFPLGMPSQTVMDKPIALGLKAGSKKYVAVWRLENKGVTNVPVPGSKARLIYPQNLGINFTTENNTLRVDFPDNYMAAVFEVED